MACQKRRQTRIDAAIRRRPSAITRRPGPTIAFSFLRANASVAAMTMRRTKIIATLGPATDSPAILSQLLSAGVNIFRLNMSHATHDWVRRLVRDIRAAASHRGQAVGILMDTQ